MEAPALPAERVAPNIPTLLKLAWPIVVSRSTQVVVGLVDALLVAHLGDAALAATTTGAMDAFCIFILPMGTVFIVSSFSSQFFGKGDREGARRFAFYGLVIAIAGEVICLALIPALPAILSVTEFTPEVRELIRGYLAIRLICGGAVVGMEALANYYGGLGNTRLPMIASVTLMVLNVIGCWLLIDGHLGFPAMGVMGSAWAATIATVIAFAGLLAYFLFEGARTGAVIPKLRAAELKQTLRFGLPSGFNWFFEFMAFLFFANVVVAGLGTTAVAALMAVIQLNSVAFMPAFALASAGAIIVGQSIGAGARDEVPKTVRLTFSLAAGWQFAVGLLYLFAPRVVFAPFVREHTSPELMQVGARMLMLSAAWQVFDAAASTLAEALRAAGDTAFTLWARLALAWLVFAPGAWLSVKYFGGGDVSAMLWLLAYIGLLAVTLYLRFRAGAWRRFNLAHVQG